MSGKIVAVAALLAFACASGKAPPVPQPAIEISAQVPYFGSFSTAPMQILFEVTNRAAVPLRVHEIDVSSPGMVQYAIYRERRIFNQTVPPGETRTLYIDATAVTTVRNPSEPLTLRALVRLEAEGQSFHQLVRQTLR